MVRAIQHRGFSFLDVLQVCVTFNNKYELYNEKVEVMESAPAGYDEAIALARRRDTLPIGVFYEVEKAPHHEALYGDHNPVKKRLTRKVRIKKVEKLLLSM
jgi:2-oxoglutarate ferredoxin oxidoreductase subunit beta